MRKKTSRTLPKAAQIAPRAIAQRAVASAAHPSVAAALGYVDVFGFSKAAGGWFFSGWVPRPANLDLREPVEFLAQYQKGQFWVRAQLTFYEREDRDHRSVGVIVFAPSHDSLEGDLKHIAFSLNRIAYQANTGHFTTRLHDGELLERMRSNLTQRAGADRNREQLLAITARAGFTGRDTLVELSETVLLEIDEAILCPPNGIFLRGWQLAAPGSVRRIRVRSGSSAGELSLQDAIRVDRPDVIAAVSKDYGFSQERCGFLAYVPCAVSATAGAYVEIELENGEIGFKGLKVSRRAGLDAIKRVLLGADIRRGDIDAAFDKTLGPAVAALDQARRRYPVEARELEFGGAARKPTASLIIPLYGRVDFAEYQMALLSRGFAAAHTEILWVLDDPAKRRECENLAASLYERFRIPFRLLLLEENVGFAGASNAGMRAARGRYLCFLNSDVFPKTERWLERLTARLQSEPDVGAIGARLLYEDGSVQHEGCRHRRVSELGDWHFVEHVHKGRRPKPSKNLARCEAITGACMLMEASLARELGGFDESYVIGDFEDSDLCLKLRARGLASAVDLSVEMYHLERKSQSTPDMSWRMNLTLYNAWVHERRWFA